MDVPVLIVVGTSVLFVVALVVFATTLIRSSRSSRRRAWEEQPVGGEVPGTDARPVDASLDGLEVEAEDASSASLLTPLRTGEWHPPAEPAPLGSLEKASLAGRIAEFQPAPDVADPPFSVPAYAAWHVDEVVQELPAPSVEPALEEIEDEADALLDAEIAALLPEPPPEIETSDAADAQVHDVTEAPSAEPVPVEPVEVSPAAAATPPAAAVPVEEQWIPPVSEPTQPESAPVPEPDALEETVFWTGLLAAQSSDQVRATPQAPPATPRPEVRVSTPAVPDPLVAEPPEALPEYEAPARPRVRVHVAAVEQDFDEAAHPRSAGVAPAPMTDRPERRLVNPRLEMAAPVEMWFGEARVGVKAGSATYDRFRKYADVLLTELRDSKNVSR